MYVIGKLSKATGITVRTLRYYDEIGILTPTILSETGYRYYDTTALMRLQQITALKQLGFSLSKIKALVAEQRGNSEEERWRTALQLQLSALHAEQERLRELERRVRVTLHGLDMTGTVHPDDILMFIHSLHPGGEQRRDAWIAQTFTPEQAAIIRDLPQLDADDPRTRQWVKLVRQLRDHMHEPPDSPIAQELARQLVTGTNAFFQGDETLAEKYWAIVRPTPGEPPKIYGLDATLADYIDAILAVWYAAKETIND